MLEAEIDLDTYNERGNHPTRNRFLSVIAGIIERGEYPKELPIINAK
jgi:hypothetical protein